MGKRLSLTFATWRGRWRPWTLCLAGLGLIGLGACTTVPSQEMSDARRAIASARNVGVEQSVPKKLMEAEHLLSTAGDALAAGAYDEARVAAASAKAVAVAARTMALQLDQLDRDIQRVNIAGVALGEEVRQLAVRAAIAAQDGALVEARALVERAYRHPNLRNTPRSGH